MASVVIIKADVTLETDMAHKEPVACASIPGGVPKGIRDPKSEGHCCVAPGCDHNHEKLKQWKDNKCGDHEGLKHSECPCPVPYSLHKIPINKAIRKLWMDALYRPAGFQLKPYSRVCSAHFKEGRPTKLNPVPSLNQEYEKTCPTTERQCDQQEFENNDFEVQPWMPLQDDNTEEKDHYDSPSTVTFSWKDHGNRLTAGLLDLLRRNCQVDTNVNFNGSSQLKVHRLILSVFLPSFEECVSPYLDLQAVAEEVDDVQALIEFIYTGEVTVREDRIEPLRCLAKALEFEELVKTIDGCDKSNSFGDHIVLYPEVAELNESNSVPSPVDEAELSEDDSQPENESVLAMMDVTSDIESNDTVSHSLPTHNLRSRKIIRKNPDDAGDAAVVKKKSVRPVKENLRNTESKCKPIRVTVKHTCTQCNKNFAKPSKLRRHVATVHEGLKSHQCGQCSLAFSEACSLRRHVACIHDGRKPYECGQCPKQFAQIGNLRRHIALVHDGQQKPERCRKCLRVFDDADGLRSHIASDHDGKKFACQQCSKVFNRITHLNNHVRLKHGLTAAACISTM